MILVPVNEIESAGDLQRDLEFAAQVARMAVLDGVPQVFALQELHHHEQALLGVDTEIVNADDVFVGHLGGRACFCQEPVAGFGVLRRRLDQDLHRHGAADDRVERLVDVGHPSAEEFLQFVFAEPRGQLHHSERDLSEAPIIRGFHVHAIFDTIP